MEPVEARVYPAGRSLGEWPRRAAGEAGRVRRHRDGTAQRRAEARGSGRIMWGRAVSSVDIVEMGKYASARFVSL